MGTTCIDCSCEKKDVSITQSFLCDTCQNQQFEKVRGNIIGKKMKVKTNAEKVIELLEEGLNPKEVAFELNLGESVVYTHRAKWRRKQ